MKHEYFSIVVRCAITGVVVFEFVVPMTRYEEAIRDSRADYIRNEWCKKHHANVADFEGEVTECSADALKWYKQNINK